VNGTILKSNLLTWEDENRLLLNLCRWPTRTRRGDFIDSVPLLLKILDILSMKLVEGEKAKLQIWITVVDQLSRSAHSDSTLWKHVNAAMRTMFKAYPAMYPGMKLLRIGLQASESTADADLAADIIRKEVTNHTRPVRSDRTTLESVVVGLTEAGDGLGEDKAQCIPERSPVPHQVFRKSLETCLRCNDTRSASAILESFNQISGTYPIGAQAELNAMVLLCYAKAGHAESAKHLLFDMMKSGMHPR
jgi:pentatricopeptide repeat protein